MGRFNTNNFIEACLIANIMCKGGGEQQVHCTFQARKNKAHSTLFHQQILPSPLPPFRRKMQFQHISKIGIYNRIWLAVWHIDVIYAFIYTHTHTLICIYVYHSQQALFFMSVSCIVLLHYTSSPDQITQCTNSMFSFVVLCNVTNIQTYK